MKDQSIFKPVGKTVYNLPSKKCRRTMMIFIENQPPGTFITYASGTVDDIHSPYNLKVMQTMREAMAEGLITLVQEKTGEKPIKIGSKKEKAGLYVYYAVRLGG